MTELKTRIKIETDGTGESYYYPQYKNCFGIWRNMKKWCAGGDFGVTITIARTTLKGAQEYIDQYVEDRKIDARKRNISVRYVKYP